MLALFPLSLLSLLAIIGPPTSARPLRSRYSSLKARAGCAAQTNSNTCNDLIAACLLTNTASNPWSTQVCVAAATCSGVGELLDAYRCSGIPTGHANSMPNLNYDVYYDIVGACAYAPGGCPISSQNFIDLIYRELSSIGSNNWPASAAQVLSLWWGPILGWTAQHSTIPYTNFNDWLHYSSDYSIAVGDSNPGSNPDPSCSILSSDSSCVDIVTACVATRAYTNPWSQLACFVAATCYGTEELLALFTCQGMAPPSAPSMPNLNYNVYAAIVGNCAWAPNGCPVTEQNYIDAYFGTLTSIDSHNYPANGLVVVTDYWSPLANWAGFGGDLSVPYKNLNDALHFYNIAPRNTPTTTASETHTTTSTSTSAITTPPTTTSSTTTAAASSTRSIVSNNCPAISSDASCNDIVTRCTTTADGTNPWASEACVAAAICAGIPNILQQLQCLGNNVPSRQSLSLDHNVYVSITGPCGNANPACNIVPQNIIDLIYRVLSAAGSTNWPIGGPNEVLSWWAPISTGMTPASYQALQDALRYFNAPTPTLSSGTSAVTTTVDTTSTINLPTATSTITEYTAISSLRISPTQFRLVEVKVDQYELYNEIDRVALQYVIGESGNSIRTLTTKTLGTSSSIYRTTTTSTGPSITTTSVVPSPTTFSQACPLLSTDPSCNDIVSWCIIVGSGVNPWNTTACVAAAICAGTKQVLNQFACLNKPVGVQGSLNLDFTVFSQITGSCSNCEMSDQNFIDLYYGVLSSAGSTNFPANATLTVDLYWDPVQQWTLHTAYSDVQYWLQTYFQSHSPASTLPPPLVVTGPSSNSSGTSSWVLSLECQNSTFFDPWHFWGDSDYLGTTADPTHGLVTYVNRTLAMSSNLTYINTTTGNAIMRVDTTPVVTGNRNSVRIESHSQYNAGTMVIWDVVHVPTGSGTWPALWSTGAQWPLNGEVDLYETVNNFIYPESSFHTTPGCWMNVTDAAFSGYVPQTDCDVFHTDTTGCGVYDYRAQAGSVLNANGGGVFAMVWTGTKIDTYFFPRNAIPADITAKTPIPENWGTPMAAISDSQCDLPTFFHDHTIIANIDLCGDWAGSVWPYAITASGETRSPAQITGYAACDDYIMSNGAALQNAYFEFRSLRIFSQST